MHANEEAAHRFMDILVAREAGKQPTRKKKPIVWKGSHYEFVKKAPTTTKGNMAEDLLSDMLKAIGYTDVQVKESRRGGWDVQVKNVKKMMQFESKLATQDTRGSYQFNGVRHDTQYTHLFLLGVQPDKIVYRIVDKKDLNDYTLTPMRKKSKSKSESDSDFKLTLPNRKKKQHLRSFDEFEGEMKATLGGPRLSRTRRKK